mmetsp:Transcript_43028/g.69099  ORF Transcript_43028/g.69099 Transcript_43028/m.69099 type:complete len:115 (+) Transcript_43028:61-405(+)
MVRKECDRGRGVAIGWSRGMDLFRRASEAHRRLKEKVHNSRIPLSRNGQILMGVVYFSIPIALGIACMDYTNSVSEGKWSVKRDKDGNVTYKTPEGVYLSREELMMSRLAEKER